MGVQFYFNVLIFAIHCLHANSIRRIHQDEGDLSRHSIEHEDIAEPRDFRRNHHERIDSDDDKPADDISDDFNEYLKHTILHRLLVKKILDKLNSGNERDKTEGDRYHWKYQGPGRHSNFEDPNAETEWGRSKALQTDDDYIWPIKENDDDISVRGGTFNYPINEAVIDRSNIEENNLNEDEIGAHRFRIHPFRDAEVEDFSTNDIHWKPINRLNDDNDYLDINTLIEPDSYISVPKNNWDLEDDSNKDINLPLIDDDVEKMVFRDDLKNIKVSINHILRGKGGENDIYNILQHNWAQILILLRDEDIEPRQRDFLIWLLQTMQKTVRMNPARIHSHYKSLASDEVLIPERTKMFLENFDRHKAFLLHQKEIANIPSDGPEIIKYLHPNYNVFIPGTNENNIHHSNSYSKELQKSELFNANIPLEGLIAKICEGVNQNVEDFWKVFYRYFSKQPMEKENLQDLEKLYLILTIFTEFNKAQQSGLPIEKYVDEIIKIIQPNVHNQSSVVLSDSEFHPNIGCVNCDTDKVIQLLNYLNDRDKPVSDQSIPSIPENVNIPHNIMHKQKNKPNTSGIDENKVGVGGKKLYKRIENVTPMYTEEETVKPLLHIVHPEHIIIKPRPHIEHTEDIILLRPHVENTEDVIIPRPLVEHTEDIIIPRPHTGHPEEIIINRPHAEHAKEIIIPRPHTGHPKEILIPRPHAERPEDIIIPRPHVEHSEGIIIPRPHTGHPEEIIIPRPNTGHPKEIIIPRPHPEDINIPRPHVEHTKDIIILRPHAKHPEDTIIPRPHTGHPEELIIPRPHSGIVLKPRPHVLHPKQKTDKPTPELDHRPEIIAPRPHGFYSHKIYVKPTSNKDHEEVFIVPRPNAGQPEISLEHIPKARYPEEKPVNHASEVDHPIEIMITPRPHTFPFHPEDLHVKPEEIIDYIITPGKEYREEIELRPHTFHIEHTVKPRPDIFGPEIQNYKPEIIHPKEDFEHRTKYVYPEETTPKEKADNKEDIFIKPRPHPDHPELIEPRPHITHPEQVIVEMKPHVFFPEHGTHKPVPEDNGEEIVIAPRPHLGHITSKPEEMVNIPTPGKEHHEYIQHRPHIFHLEEHIVKPRPDIFGPEIQLFPSKIYPEEITIKPKLHDEHKDTIHKPTPHTDHPEEPISVTIPHTKYPEQVIVEVKPLVFHPEHDTFKPVPEEHGEEIAITPRPHIGLITSKPEEIIIVHTPKKEHQEEIKPRPYLIYLEKHTLKPAPDNKYPEEISAKPTLDRDQEEILIEHRPHIIFPDIKTKKPDQDKEHTDGNITEIRPYTYHPDINTIKPTPDIAQHKETVIIPRTLAIDVEASTIKLLPDSTPEVKTVTPKVKYADIPHGLKPPPLTYDEFMKIWKDYIQSKDFYPFTEPYGSETVEPIVDVTTEAGTNKPGTETVFIEEKLVEITSDVVRPDQSTKYNKQQSISDIPNSHNLEFLDDYIRTDTPFNVVTESKEKIPEDEHLATKPVVHPNVIHPDKTTANPDIVSSEVKTIKPDADIIHKEEEFNIPTPDVTHPDHITFKPEVHIEHPELILVTHRPHILPLEVETLKPSTDIIQLEDTSNKPQINVISEEVTVTRRPHPKEIHPDDETIKSEENINHPHENSKPEGNIKHSEIFVTHEHIIHPNEILVEFKPGKIPSTHKILKPEEDNDHPDVAFVESLPDADLEDKPKEHISHLDETSITSIPHSEHAEDVFTTPTPRVHHYQNIFSTRRPHLFKPEVETHKPESDIVYPEQFSHRPHFIDSEEIATRPEPQIIHPEDETITPEVNIDVSEEFITHRPHFIHPEERPRPQEISPEDVTVPDENIDYSGEYVTSEPSEEHTEYTHIPMGPYIYQPESGTNKPEANVDYSEEYVPSRPHEEHKEYTHIPTGSEENISPEEIYYKPPPYVFHPENIYMKPRPHIQPEEIFSTSRPDVVHPGGIRTKPEDYIVYPGKIYNKHKPQEIILEDISAEPIVIPYPYQEVNWKEPRLPNTLWAKIISLQKYYPNINIAAIINNRNPYIELDKQIKYFEEQKKLESTSNKIDDAENYINFIIDNFPAVLKYINEFLEQNPNLTELLDHLTSIVKIPEKNVVIKVVPEISKSREDKDQMHLIPDYMKILLQTAKWNINIPWNEIYRIILDPRIDVYTNPDKTTILMENIPSHVPAEIPSDGPKPLETTLDDNLHFIIRLVIHYLKTNLKGIFLDGLISQVNLNIIISFIVKVLLISLKTLMANGISSRIILKVVVDLQDKLKLFQAPEIRHCAQKVYTILVEIVKSVFKNIVQNIH